MTPRRARLYAKSTGVSEAQCGGMRPARGGDGGQCTRRGRYMIGGEVLYRWELRGMEYKAIDEK